MNSEEMGTQTGARLVGLKLDRDVYDQIAIIAEQQERSVSAQVRFMIKQQLTAYHRMTDSQINQGIK